VLRVVLVGEEDEATAAAVQNAVKALGTHWRMERCARTADALRELLSPPPALAIVADHLRDVSGNEFAARLVNLLPDVPVIILSPSREPETILHCLQAGARGYLIKGAASAHDFAEAMTRALAGFPALCQEAQSAVLEAIQRMGRASARFHLSAGEQRVVRMLASGTKEKEIARALSRATGTVHSQVKHIYKKLHVHSRRQALARYLGIN
jgi:DNA-binding NarL/FixJ family response regulator